MSAKGVSDKPLPASAVTPVPSPDGDTDSWGVGGGGIANLSCSCLDRVEAAGATVGNRILLAANVEVMQTKVTKHPKAFHFRGG